jgi:hypothetical protein
MFWMSRQEVEQVPSPPELRYYEQLIVDAENVE